MVGFVVASHGAFCEGLKESTEMIGGPIPQCVAVALRPGEDPDAYGERLLSAVKSVDDGEGVLILIDLRGGTPFNRSLMLARDEHVVIAVGANLPMLLTLALGRSEDSTLDALAEMAENEAKESIGTIKYTV